MVNDEVEGVPKTCLSPIKSISNKQGKYLTLTPAQLLEVSKRAAGHGVTAAALACFDKKLRIIWISRLPFALQFLS